MLNHEVSAIRLGESFSAILNCPVPALTPEEQTLLGQMLAPASPSAVQGFLRNAAGGVSFWMPSLLRRVMLFTAKKARNAFAKPLQAPADCRGNQVVSRLREACGGEITYLGRQAAACLSFDVDQKRGYDYLPELLALLDRLRLKSTFNILTDWEYEIDWERIREIRDAGHEIGLHGRRHDIGLGYRDEAKIRSELRQALDVIPFPVEGYRAPALCMTPRLMRIVREFGFRYDTSLPMSNRYYACVELCFPYQIAEGLWEVPVTLQDSSLFQDYGMDETHAIEAARRSVEDVSALSGLSMLNLHPYVLTERRKFTDGVLGWLSERQDKLLVATTRSVIDLLEERACSSNSSA